MPLAHFGITSSEVRGFSSASLTAWPSSAGAVLAVSAWSAEAACRELRVLVLWSGRGHLDILQVGPEGDKLLSKA